jgi:Phosphoinositide phospholipase C, Ca2+-dependent
MKVVRTLLICTFLLSLVAAAFAVNPDRDIHQLAHRSWGEKEGYPGKGEALAQTADGFLWLGSDNGLFRFDGVHFERYVPRSGDKLSEGPVRGLLALPDGSLWITHRLENKICVLRNGNVKCYGIADGVASNPTTIVQDHERSMWANTGQPDCAFTEENDGTPETIAALVRKGYLVRTRTDADTKEARTGETARRDAVLASGAQLLSTDYPASEPSTWTNYSVSLPGGAVARCDPANAPANCMSTALSSATYN